MTKQEAIALARRAKSSVESADWHKLQPQPRPGGTWVVMCHVTEIVRFEAKTPHDLMQWVELLDKVFGDTYP